MATSRQSVESILTMEKTRLTEDVVQPEVNEFNCSFLAAHRYADFGWDRADAALL